MPNGQFDRTAKFNPLQHPWMYKERPTPRPLTAEEHARIWGEELDATGELLQSPIEDRPKQSALAK
jgi:hypothetical protein